MIAYIKSRREFTKYIQSDSINQRREIEQFLAEQHKNEKKWYFYGFCDICSQNVAFLMDWRYSTNLIPNYRERLVCPVCQLNNRQRFIGSVVKEKLTEQKNKKKIRLYFMEQVTNFYKYFKKAYSNDDQVTIIGSEYLGMNVKSGELINGFRHEDVGELSFPNNYFDMIISNDVFEHIPVPLRAFRECFRVLKKGGELIITIPFNHKLLRNIKRVEMLPNNSFEYLREPIYHGNPMSQIGSLVFYDFGWEVIDWLIKAEFPMVLIGLYWSYDCGYLGNGCQIFFVCKR